MSNEAKKIFLGMHRPDWNELVKRTAGSYVMCSCGSSLQTMGQLREHWQQGHCDEILTREPFDDRQEVETLIYELGRLSGAPGVAGELPIVTPLATLRWLVAEKRRFAYKNLDGREER